MEIPRYLQILWSYKWLLVAGLLVAIVAGVFAGFTLQNGQFVSRAKHNYTAATTVMLEGENSTLLQAVIPGEEVDQTTTASIRQDLGSVAVLYAYLAASEEMQARVESVVGDFSDDEQMTAVSRTTQPNGDERFPGRLVLPIIDVVGVSDDAARAELISQAAAEQFREYIVEQQQTELIPTDARVILTTLKAGKATEAVPANPAFPIIVTAGGVILGFIALVYLINGIRARYRTPNRRARIAAAKRKRDAKLAKAEAAAEAEAPAEEDAEAEDEEVVEETTDADSERTEPIASDEELPEPVEDDELEKAGVSGGLSSSASRQQK